MPADHLTEPKRSQALPHTNHPPPERRHLLPSNQLAVATKPSRCRSVFNHHDPRTYPSVFSRHSPPYPRHPEILNRQLTPPFSPTEPQDFPHQAKACQSSASEPPHPPVDSSAHRQHHQVNCALILHKKTHTRRHAAKKRIEGGGDGNSQTQKPAQIAP